MPERLLDLDHVVLTDGRIYRVLGNLDSATHFYGYNIYSPAPDGDRLYKGRRYTKQYTEDNTLPADVRATYEMIPRTRIAEHHDPISSAASMSATFTPTIWSSLYTELARIFGHDRVGVFGSAMFGLHLTPDGRVRKDIDFVIDGIANLGLLRQELPRIRDTLGFTTITPERQLQQYQRYQRVFRNPNNSIQAIIARRWSGLQLSDRVVTTIRLREPTCTLDPRTISQPTATLPNSAVTGRVRNAAGSNLFPRTFTIHDKHGQNTHVSSFWWKFTTPVEDDDPVTVCGSVLAAGDHPAIRLTDFTQHWLRIGT
jgi:predicted nucleotidyltransferase